MALPSQAHPSGELERGGSPRKVCVLANGCCENRIDAAAKEKLCREARLTLTADYREADIIFLNACAATSSCQENSIRIVSALGRKKKPSAELIVCGCLPRIAEARLREVHGGTVLKTEEIEPLARLLGVPAPAGPFPANHPLPVLLRSSPRKLTGLESLISAPKLLTRLYHVTHKRGADDIGPDDFCIKISSGCLGVCSYCAIRFSRGRVKSKPIDEVAAEFDRGYAAGHREFTLIGTDLGAYGRDRDTDLVALLKELLGRNGDYRIKLQHIHPRLLIDMLPGLCDVFRSGRIARYCCSLQSGSDRILELMRRGYRSGEFKEAVLRLHSESPGTAMCTQVIIGFPGETGEEFRDTVRVLDEIPFAAADAFVFEPRPNTVAARMKEQVPRRVAVRRLLKLYGRSFLRKGRVFVW